MDLLEKSCTIDKLRETINDHTNKINGNISINDIIDFPKSLPASDVYAWAKELTKPKYTATEVGADPSGSATNALNEAKLYTDKYVDEKISNLINSAPETLDTLGELANALNENETVVEALDSAINNRALNSDLTSHTSNNNNPHNVTKEQVGLGNVNNTSDSEKIVKGVTINNNENDSDNPIWFSDNENKNTPVVDNDLSYNPNSKTLKSNNIKSDTIKLGEGYLYYDNNTESIVIGFNNK